MNRAEEYFAVEGKLGCLRDMLVDDILAACDVPAGDYDAWPCDDFSFDAHDLSFELHGVKDGFSLTQEQQKRLRDLGFLRCWLNHQNGKQTYYYFDPHYKTVDPN